MTDYRIHRPSPPTRLAAPAPKPRETSPAIWAGAGAVGMLLVVALVLGVSKGGWSWPVVGPSITDNGYGVLIVQESQDRTGYTSTQLDAMDSQADDSLSAIVKAKGGTFRVLDTDDDVSQDTPAIREVWKLDRKSLPWLYVWKGGRVQTGPLTTEAAAIEAAKKYGK